MQRYSYEWVDPEGGDPHFSDDLYAIYDAKRGFTDPFAWGFERDDAETIVAALNAAEERRATARAVMEMAIERDKYDLSDLLN